MYRCETEVWIWWGWIFVPGGLSSVQLKMIILGIDKELFLEDISVV